MFLCASAIPSPSFFENHCGLRHFIYLMYYSKLESLVCVCLCVCVYAQSCPTLCDPVDCSPLGASFHGISQARILEWVAISFSRGTVLMMLNFRNLDSLCAFEWPPCPSGLAQCPSCEVLAFWPLMYSCLLFSVPRLEVSHCSENPNFLSQEGHEKLRSDLTILTVHLKRLGCYVSFTTMKRKKQQPRSRCWEDVFIAAVRFHIISVDRTRKEYFMSLMKP